MKRFIFSIIFLVTLSGFSFSQTDKPGKFEILACSLKLTEAGRQSYFRFGFRYWTLTNEEGAVKKVTFLGSKSNSETYADSSDVISCLEKLKLSPSSKYMIYISFGTTGDENFLSISNKNEKIKIIL